MDQEQNSPNRNDRNRISGFNRPRTSKEWKLIEKMVASAQDEQRKARRWGIFFKLAGLAYLLLALLVFGASRWSGDMPSTSKPHTAVVEVNGIIMADSEANADTLVSGIRDAFKAENAKGVVLRINSPGGSPVQSGLVYREIRRLKNEFPHKKVYAVITDVGASGAYYIAAAADEIYADPASIVGSIGVVSDGFGFVGAMEKLGVERRVFTSGANKAMLDPFQPLEESQRAYFASILGDVHQQFIDAVKEGRGNRLKDDPEIFSGLFWSGRQALDLGLVDGLASTGQVAREIVGQEDIVNYTPRRNPLDSLIGKLGVSMADRFMSALGVGSIRLQ